MHRLRAIKPPVWYLLTALFVVALLPLIARMLEVESAVVSYLIQPFAAIGVALIARAIGRGQRDRMHHKAEKSLIIGSVLAVWFVAYFATGMVLTYTHNAVAASWQAIILNVGAFGIAAIAMEYVRHTIMLLINRRDGVWFGLIVAVVFAIEQIGLVQILGLTDGIGIVKFTVATIMPALVSSALLTYLAFNVGFSAQLTYRLGIVAVLYVPPIIPKYDWYVIGIAWLVLALSVYLVIDHTRREVAINGRHYRHARRATNSMFVIAMTGLVCFMTGVFSYQPQVIMSNSMVPVFSRGAMVIVEKVDAMDVRVGDIIQYKTTERMITHRVIEIDTTDDGTGERVYITQGDNSPNPDEKPVQLAQVVGIIRAQIPYVGYPTVWLREIMK